MLVFVIVFLSEAVLTIAQSDYQNFFVIHSFREPGKSPRLTQIPARSGIECSLECEKIATCRAANFHSGDNLCDLIKPGPALMSLEASTGWMFVYTYTKDLDRFFNAVASQKSNYFGGVAERAIDGKRNSNFFGGSCSHTKSPSSSYPWWMVELYVNFHVERVIMWNRLDCGSCYSRLRNLKITVSQTIGGIDEPANVCGTYPGPPRYPSDNPVKVQCTRVMLGRYIKILRRGNGILSLCEFDFA